MSKQIKKEVRLKVWNKYKGKCAYCGDLILLDRMHIDHIIPKSRFRANLLNNYGIPSFLKHLEINNVNHIDNLFPSCPTCNLSKSDWDLEIWRVELCMKVERLRKRVVNFKLVEKFKLITIENNVVIFYYEKEEGNGRK